MADPVKLTIDGQEVQAAPGTLVIDAAKKVGIEIPAFCYYEGLSLQAACRMCLVEVEKMPKMMTACTLPVSEGMVVRTETEQVKQARGVIHKPGAVVVGRAILPAAGLPARGTVTLDLDGKA